MAVSQELLEILACPACKAKVEVKPDGKALKCVECKRVYPIRDDIPVMLIDEATIEELFAMNSLRDIVAASPKLRGVETQARSESKGIDAPQPLAPARWDWSQVRKVLFVRLRSIGDTVLATSAVNAL